jgi:hypothetical protein
MSDEEINMDELILIENPRCWNCDTGITPLYIDCGVNGDSERATTCLPCYKEKDEQ